MQLERKIQLKWNLEILKAKITTLMNLNIDKKLNWYLKQFESKKDATGSIELIVEKNKKWRFTSRLKAYIDWKTFRFERENYKNLDDLINHLFSHFKEALSS